MTASPGTRITAVPGVCYIEKRKRGRRGSFRFGYSDDISGHYFRCKGFNDLGMENITKTMNAIAAEADKVEKSE